MAQLEFGVPYLARAASLAQWSVSAETYGTPAAMQYLNTFQGKKLRASDRLPVGGANEHLLSVVEGAELTVKNAGIDLPILRIIQNINDTLSGSGDAAVRTFDFEGGDDDPYFGFIVALPIQGGSELHIGYRRCKVMEGGLDMNAEPNAKYTIPEMKIEAARLRLSDGTVKGLLRWKHYAVETAVSTNFNTWFA